MSNNDSDTLHESFLYNIVIHENSKSLTCTISDHAYIYTHEQDSCYIV